MIQYPDATGIDQLNRFKKCLSLHRTVQYYCSFRLTAYIPAIDRPTIPEYIKPGKVRQKAGSYHWRSEACMLTGVRFYGLNKHVCDGWQWLSHALIADRLRHFDKNDKADYKIQPQPSFFLSTTVQYSTGSWL